MPLKVVPTDGYIKRQFITVNSKDRDPQLSKDALDYTVLLGTEIQNVISMELAGWNFDPFFSSTFPGRYNTQLSVYDPSDTKSPIPGAKTFTLRIYDELGVSFVDLPVDLENSQGSTYTLSSANQVIYLSQGSDWFNTTPEFTQVVKNAIVGALTAFGTAGIDETNTTIEVYFSETLSGVRDNEIMYIVAYRSGGANDPMRTVINFTPQTQEPFDHAALALGFEEGSTVDSQLISTPGVGSGTNYVLRSAYEVNNLVYRYVDLFVKQTEDSFSPFERIFFKRGAALTPYLNGDKVIRTRLLTDPVRKLDRLSIRLELPNNIRIADSALKDHQLVFEVLSLAQEISVPDWVKCRLNF